MSLVSASAGARWVVGLRCRHWEIFGGDEYPPPSLGLGTHIGSDLGQVTRFGDGSAALWQAMVAFIESLGGVDALAAAALI